MKRLFSLMVVALFGMSAMAQAVIKFEKTSINLGTFNPWSYSRHLGLVVVRWQLLPKIPLRQEQRE